MTRKGQGGRLPRPFLGNGVATSVKYLLECVVVDGWSWTDQLAMENTDQARICSNLYQPVVVRLHRHTWNCCIKPGDSAPLAACRLRLIIRLSSRFHLIGVRTIRLWANMETNWDLHHRGPQDSGEYRGAVICVYVARVSEDQWDASMIDVVTLWRWLRNCPTQSQNPQFGPDTEGKLQYEFKFAGQ